MYKELHISINLFLQTMCNGVLEVLGVLKVPIV